MFQQTVAIITLLCLSAVLVSGEIARRKEIESRIVRQQLGIVRQTPFVVQFRDGSGTIVCAGSLISSQHVMTAAHCFDKYEVSDLKVVASATSNTDEGVELSVEKLTKHDSYNPSTFHNDVALVKLGSPFELPQNVKIPAICSKPFAATDNFYLIAGWPKTEQTNLMFGVNAPIMFQEECIEDCKEEGFDVEITSSMVCNDPRDRYACEVVAGGPALSSSKEICGIVVGGSACGNQRFPGIYTNVYEVRDFIEKTLKA